jgi:hypothetical protein
LPSSAIKAAVEGGGPLGLTPIREPELMKEIELNLEHKKLENELLKRQTELLEKSPEYRSAVQLEVLRAHDGHNRYSGLDCHRKLGLISEL